MPRLNLNIFANASGQIWGLLLSFFFTPLYIHALGIESYGLIAIYWMLVGLMQVFDLGLGPMMNREISRSLHSPQERDRVRTLLRTCEIFYLLVAMALALLIVLGADLIATFWIKANSLDKEELSNAVALMGVLLALQWPINLYQNVLMGMQQQVIANILTGIFAAITNLAALFAVLGLGYGIRAFFVAAAIVTAFQLTSLAIVVWRKLRSSGHRPAFSLSILRQSWGFAIGMAGISVVSVLLTQIDKVLLSKLLPLEGFGLYVLAGMLSRALYVVITPIFSAVFPRFTSALSQGDEGGAIRIYHLAAQLMAALVLSAAFSLAIFSHDIFSIWLRSQSLADQTAPIASILVFGTAMNGLMNVPYAIQLAKGHTRIPFLIAVCVAVPFVPCMIWTASSFGAIGAAWTWFGLNLMYLIAGVGFTYSLVLIGQFREWLVRDTGIPLMLIVMAAVLIGWTHHSTAVPNSPSILAVFVGSAMMCLAGLVGAKDIRRWIATEIRTRTSRAA